MATLLFKACDGDGSFILFYGPIKWSDTDVLINKS